MVVATTTTSNAVAVSLRTSAISQPASSEGDALPQQPQLPLNNAASLRLPPVAGCPRGRTAVGMTASPAKDLHGGQAHEKIAGVCAGFARYLDVDVVFMCVLWLAIGLTTGVGFLAFLAAWIIIPATTA